MRPNADARASSLRFWGLLWLLLLTGVVPLPLGWLLQAGAARRRLRWPWLAGAAGLWAAAWTVATGWWWLRTFYAADAALVGAGRFPRAGGTALGAGWVCWALLVAAALPGWRAWAGPWLAGRAGPRAAQADGTELGLDARGRPGVLTDAQANTGVLICGAPGSGKTTAELRIAGAVLRRGHALICIDGKGSPAFRRHLEEAAAACGRPLATWSLVGPAHYDPLAHGTATELRDKLTAVEQWTEPHYRRAAERYLGAALAALRAAGRGVTLGTVAQMLQPKALEGLCRAIPDRAAAERLGAYLDGLERDASSRSAISGLANRVATLAESEAGPWLEPGGGTTLDLWTAASCRGAALFSLDSLRYPGLTAQVGALLLQDLRTVAGQLLEAGNAAPVYVLIDEFNVFEGPHVLALFNKGREAGLCCVLATQDLADVVAAGGETLTDQLLANAGTKLLLRTDVGTSARRLAASVGMRPAWAPSRRTLGGAALAEGSVHATQEYVLNPDLLLQLPPHQGLLVRKVPELEVRHLRLHPADGGRRGPGAPPQEGDAVPAARA